MKISLFIAVMTLALVAAASEPETAGQKNEGQVRAALDEYIEAVESEDLEHYGRVVGHDADMMNFGAFGDPIVGWEGLRAVMEGQNAALDSIQIEQSDVVVRVLGSGDDAWATSMWRFRARAGNNVLELPVRCTWQLQKRGKTWQVVHFHKSIAAQ